MRRITLDEWYGSMCSIGTISGRLTLAGLRVKCCCTWSSSEPRTSVRCSSRANTAAAHWSLSSSDKRWASRYGGGSMIFAELSKHAGNQRIDRRIFALILSRLDRFSLNYLIQRTFMTSEEFHALVEQYTYEPGDYNES